MQKSTPLNWNDVRFVVALAEQRSLSGTARLLGVDHTTVGRRVDAAEAALDVRLFTRSATGYALTLDGARLLPDMQAVAAAVQTLRRRARAGETAIEGTVRVTAPETFGMTWLARALSGFAAAHPLVTVQLDPTGALADLGLGEAELAIRNVRSTDPRLVVVPVAEIPYGAYASVRYLAEHPVRAGADLVDCRVLCTPAESVESAWLARLVPSVRPAFVSELSLALLAAAKAHAGVALLPRFLGDAEPTLQYIPLPGEPSEPLWLTVHEDARSIPRVRALMSFLRKAFREAQWASGPA